MLTKRIWEVNLRNPQASYEKTNVWEHPQLNESAIIHYQNLFLKKLLAPETLKKLISVGYDIELLMEKFSEIKNIIESKIDLKSKLFEAKLSKK